MVFNIFMLICFGYTTAALSEKFFNWVTKNIEKKAEAEKAERKTKETSYDPDFMIPSSKSPPAPGAKPKTPSVPTAKLAKEKTLEINKMVVSKQSKLRINAIAEGINKAIEKGFLWYSYAIDLSKEEHGCKDEIIKNICDFYSALGYQVENHYYGRHEITFLWLEAEPLQRDKVLDICANINDYPPEGACLSEE